MLRGFALKHFCTLALLSLLYLYTLHFTLYTLHSQHYTLHSQLSTIISLHCFHQRRTNWDKLRQTKTKRDKEYPLVWRLSYLCSRKQFCASIKNGQIRTNPDDVGQCRTMSDIEFFKWRIFAVENVTVLTKSPFCGDLERAAPLGKYSDLWKSVYFPGGERGGCNLSLGGET